VILCILVLVSVDVLAEISLNAIFYYKIIILFPYVT
jgi:hypothetical protein